MLRDLFRQLAQSAAQSRNRKVAAFAVFLICFGFLLWYGAVTRGLFLKPEPVVVSPVLTESGAALLLPKATPMKIRIKKANIEANFFFSQIERF